MKIQNDNELEKRKDIRESVELNRVLIEIKELHFTLKVSHKYQQKIYRIIEVSGNDTLDRLHTIIVDAFGFDDDHLYMFSFTRKKYDKNGYYAPGSGGGRSAARVKLGELGLKPRNKFLFLYDFGDEWEFNVAVSKVTELETKVQKKVIESQGELTQYDYGDKDDSGPPYLLDFGVLEEKLVLRNNFTLPQNVLYQGDCYRIGKCEINMEAVLFDADPEMQVRLFQAVGLKQPDDPKYYATALADYYRQASAAFLEILTSEDIVFLDWLFKKDYRGFLRNNYLPASVFHLQALGLMRVSVEDIYYIEIVEEIEALEAAVENMMQVREIEKESEIEQITMALIRLYAVVEKETLRQLVSDSVKFEIDEVLFEESLIRKNLFWQRIVLYQDADQNEYYTCYIEEESIREVLENRQKYHISDYKQFDCDYCIRLTRENAATTVWCERLARDLLRSVGDFYVAHTIVEDIESLVRIGCDDEEFLDLALQLFCKLEISRTKKLIDTLRKLHESYPSGGLKGYTWKELNQTLVNVVSDDGSFQLSMFGDIV